MHSVLAASPIVLILALMLGAGWSAARAGLLGLGLALLLALTVFDLGGPGVAGTTAGAAPAIGPWLAGAGVLAEGGFITLTILWILWPALALHQHQQDSGALDALRAGLARLTPQRPLQVLLVGWCLGLFLEGAAGFGTPVALVAPILVGLGVAPLPAVLLALLGHAAGVSFGALGTPVLAQVALTGLDGVQIAWRTAALQAALGGVLMVFFVRELGRALPMAQAVGAGTQVTRPWAWAALAAAAFLLPMLALAAWLGPELATLGAALVSALVMATMLTLSGRWRGRDAAQRGEAQDRVASVASGADGASGASGAHPESGANAAIVAEPGPSGLPGAMRHAGPAISHTAVATPSDRPTPSLARALAPYAALVVLVLATRSVPPLAEVLGAAVLQWQWLDGRFSARMQPLLHPGSLLFAALLLGAWAQGVPLPRLGPSLAVAARRLLPVTVALLAMLCLSRLMLHAGMIDALQRGAVQAVGRGWPLLAPAIGALGSFVTGSATASNVLFTPLQVQMAQALGLSAPWLAAAQGLGAAVGNIVCPHNVVAGAATVGLAGREGQILRRTLLPAALVLSSGGVLVVALVTG